jgi:flagellar biosynthetic protein FlhB
MSEDRTQEPSNRRRLEARQRGQVARSPELTGAAALLAASALLGIWGDELALGLVGLIRDSWSGDLMVGADSSEVVARIRSAVWGVVGPLFGILGGTLAVAIVAHQAQVGGLFAPGLIAPDFSRLWRLHLDEEGIGSTPRQWRKEPGRSSGRRRSHWLWRLWLWACSTSRSSTDGLRRCCE